MTSSNGLQQIYIWIFLTWKINTSSKSYKTIHSKNPNSTPSFQTNLSNASKDFSFFGV